MTLGAVAALKGRTTKILFFTSLALLIVSIILVPTTVAPERVSPAELVRAGSAVLSLIVSVIIIVLLSTAQAASGSVLVHQRIDLGLLDAVRLLPVVGALFLGAQRRLRLS